MKLYLLIGFAATVGVSAIIGFLLGRELTLSNQEKGGNDGAKVESVISVGHQWSRQRIEDNIKRGRFSLGNSEVKPIAVKEMLINKQDAFYVNFSARLLVADQAMELHAVVDQETGQPIAITSGRLLNNPSLTVREFMGRIIDLDEETISVLRKVDSDFTEDVKGRQYFQNLIHIWERIQNNSDNVDVKIQHTSNLSEIATSVTFSVEYLSLYFKFDSLGQLQILMMVVSCGADCQNQDHGH